MTGRHVLLAAAAGFGALLAFVGLLAALGPTSPNHAAPSKARTASTTTSTAVVGALRALAPATTVPAETPLQQSYDDALAQGFAAPANRTSMALADALALPRPAIGGGWRAVAPEDTPEGYALAFVSALLDVDFTRQSREGLGAWLLAESAPDLMPGIPSGFAERTLYASVMAPVLTGMSSPLPSAALWARDAHERVRFSVRDLEVQLDPQWQSLVDAGWQPRDLRAAVEDLSGVFVVTRGRSVTRRRFSLVVQIGSARFHPGYGAVLLSDWKES